jgi:hypothetical protein
MDVSTHWQTRPSRLGRPRARTPSRRRGRTAGSRDAPPWPTQPRTRARCRSSLPCWYPTGVLIQTRMRGGEWQRALVEAGRHLAEGESAIKIVPISTLNVLKDTHDHSCYRACSESDEHQRLMAGSPSAGRHQPQELVRGRVEGGHRLRAWGVRPHCRLGNIRHRMNMLARLVRLVWRRWAVVQKRRRGRAPRGGPARTSPARTSTRCCGFSACTADESCTGLAQNVGQR